MKTQELSLLVSLATFWLGCSSNGHVGGIGAAAGSSGAFGGGGQAAPGGGGGAAGAKGVLERGGLADISGRWGMFKFEDPVGVELFEAPDGTLSGHGCAAGAPGSPDTSTLYYCGAITGKVTGETATFSFPLLEGEPDLVDSASVTISRDRQRMAGGFTTKYGPLWPMAWLRVRWDAAWLDRIRPTDGDPLGGWYALELMADESVGSEFVAGTVYQLGYSDRTVAGDLGSFWNSEMSDPAQGSPLRVGPVPVTVPSLPTSLSLDFDDTGFVMVTASTPSGGVYRFSAKHM